MDLGAIAAELACLSHTKLSHPHASRPLMNRPPLTGAKCDWTPLGNPIFPTHSSRTLIFALIWTARDLHEAS